MIDSLPTMPVVCYLEVPPWNDQAGAAGGWLRYQRARVQVMPCVSTFYGTTKDDGTAWIDNGEAPDTWWDDQWAKVESVWDAQGPSDRRAFSIAWFNDSRLPAGSQLNFSNELAQRTQRYLAAKGGVLDLVFADNEETDARGRSKVPAAELDRAFGALRSLARVRGNFAYARGRSWWGNFWRPPVDAGVIPAYHVTNPDAEAELCRTIDANGPKGIVWLPCSHEKTAEGWKPVDWARMLDHTQAVIMYHVFTGGTRFGLFIENVPEKFRDDYTTFVGQTIERAEKMAG